MSYDMHPQIYSALSVGIRVPVNKNLIKTVYLQKHWSKRSHSTFIHLATPDKLSQKMCQRLIRPRKAYSFYAFLQDTAEFPLVHAS